MLGSGRMARGVLEGMSVVRRLKSLKVFSPTKENREKFAADVARQLDLSAKAVDSPESVTKDADMVIVCTDTSPFFSSLGLALAFTCNLFRSRHRRRYVYAE